MQPILPTDAFEIHSLATLSRGAGSFNTCPRSSESALTILPIEKGGRPNRSGGLRLLHLGEFYNLDVIGIDSEGNVYTAEVKGH